MNLNAKNESLIEGANHKISAKNRTPRARLQSCSLTVSFVLHNLFLLIPYRLKYFFRWYLKDVSLNNMEYLFKVIDDQITERKMCVSLEIKAI